MSHVPTSFPFQSAEPSRDDRRSRILRAHDSGDDVGSAAIEAALGDLDRAIRRDRCHAVVAAPPGSGKTLLLRGLSERLQGSLPVVHVRPPWGEEEICEQILRALGEDPGRDPELRLLSVVQEIGSRGAGLVLLVEDADALSASVLRRLGRLAALSRPDLRLALAVTTRNGSEGEGIRWVVGALGVSAEKVVLDDEMRRTDLPLAALPEPVDLREAVDEKAREERAIEAMHLEPRTSASGAVRWVAAVALAICVALIGANRISIQPAGGMAREPAPPAAPAIASAPATHDVLASLEPLPGLASSVRDSSSTAPAAGSADPAAMDPLAPAPVSAGAPQAPEAAAPIQLALATPASSLAEPTRSEPKLTVEPKPVAPPAAKPAVAKPTAPVETLATARPVSRTKTAAAPKPKPLPPTPEPTLQAAAATVPVSMNAKPWARIEVDGREVGVTPLADVPLATGHHQFRAHLPDGSTVEREAQVDAYRDRFVFP